MEHRQTERDREGPRAGVGAGDGARGALGCEGQPAAEGPAVHPGRPAGSSGKRKTRGGEWNSGGFCPVTGAEHQGQMRALSERSGVLPALTWHRALQGLRSARKWSESVRAGGGEAAS